MKTRLSVMLAAALLSIYVFAQSEPNALGNFDHVVSPPAPGGDTNDGGPQAVSDLQSVAGVPLIRLNNGVMMPRFGLGTGTVAEGWIDDAVRFWEAQMPQSSTATEHVSAAPQDATAYDLQGRPVSSGFGTRFVAHIDKYV
ncbi:MAG: hypothetical protein IJV55_07355 [Paludibacteraceae bacterium]|nr:hypothetical protein [Paludibacteraceae bacterium]